MKDWTAPVMLLAVALIGNAVIGALVYASGSSGRRDATVECIRAGNKKEQCAAWSSGKPTDGFVAFPELGEP